MKWLLRALFISLSLSAQGCGLSLRLTELEPITMSSSTASGAGSSGIVAFQKGLYTWVRQQGCVQCHGNGTSRQFAVDDVNVAYANAKTIVDFNHPTQSIFVPHATNGHCGISSICGVASNQAVIEGYLSSWAEAELGTPSGGSSSTGGSPGGAPALTTISVALPANLPTLVSGKTAVVRFPLSSLNIPSVQNAIFEVQVQLANSSEYRVSSPRLGGTTAPVQIQGIHVFVKSSEDSGIGAEDTEQGNLWDSDTVTAPAFALPSPLGTAPLTSPVLDSRALGIEVQSASDMLTIGFDSIQ